ncbi:hypothetical protein CAL26_22805 [Bordetella genomosp. 9]|uniref:Uncharacterized protein n=1 Tax=Bordetella genomosp. 9 TaxID=1416803 RepID=A0A261R7J7_9BORD|nr:hypothetical protein CAL26_22805 [Bordetella genomosp. 9]
MLPSRLLAGIPSQIRRAAGIATPPSTDEATQQPCTTGEFLQIFRAVYPDTRAVIGLVPHELRMGRSRYLDLNGVERAPAGNISETETVWNSCVVLGDAKRRAMPDEQALSSSLYFDSILLQAEPGPSQAAAFLAQKQVDQQTLTTLLSQLDKSATFKVLLRRAVEENVLTLSGPRRWLVALVSPGGHRDGMAFYGGGGGTGTTGTAFGVDRANQLITLPLRDDRPVGNFLYLFAGGRLLPLDPVCHAIRALVSVLTEADPQSPSAWMGVGGRIDPQRIVDLGAGERGAVDYLSQRILAELGLECRWLSPLHFIPDTTDAIATGAPLAWRPGDAMRLALNALGGVEALDQYVAWQNVYLEEQFPLGR